ncbi:phosphatidylinositol transfer protein beta [Cyclospora cayetanensis]|uniref:Phosphatidylinositol transfer protein beta n=1 Tax=Cyclospora cayetanensis TaxID=88456 RepID=A0A1D3D4F2_9EIME|nr:phosphatidylinositol transfer protein beta [Cyclospora cayetanensis]
MKIVEFRLVLPLTPEEYRRCQIFLVALAALETAEAQKATEGPPKAPMIQILASEDYSANGEQGQYTHKRIDLVEKLPGWILKFVDPRSCAFEEKSWNAFPRLRTQYESAKFSKAKVSITSNHVSGVCTDDNATDLPPEKLRQRKIDLIDIVNDGSAGGVDDLRNWKSEKANFGPLLSDWIKNVPLVPSTPQRAPRRRLRGGAVLRKRSSSTLREAFASHPPEDRRGSEAGEVSLGGCPEAAFGGSPDALAAPKPPDGDDKRPSDQGAPSSSGPPQETSATLVPAYPLMTCYKCFEIDFPYFGILSGRIEAWVVSSMREQLMHYHRRAIASIDRWYDLSLEEVRQFEEDVRQQLAVLAALSRTAEEAPREGVSERPLERGEEAEGEPLMEAEETTTEGTVEYSDSDIDKASGEGGPRRRHEGSAQQRRERPPKELLNNAVEDWRLYSGARLLPLQLSPQSVSLLQRLQQGIQDDQRRLRSAARSRGGFLKASQPPRGPC